MFLVSQLYCETIFFLGYIMFRHSNGYIDSDLDSFLDSYMNSDVDSDEDLGIRLLYDSSGWTYVSGRDVKRLRDRVEVLGGNSLFSSYGDSFDFRVFFGDIYELFMQLGYSLYLDGHNPLDIGTVKLLDVDLNKKVLHFGCNVVDYTSSYGRIFNSTLLKGLLKDAKSADDDCVFTRVNGVSFKKGMLILEVCVLEA